MKNLTEEQKRELEELKDFNLCILDFVSQLSVEASPLFMQAKAIIEDTYVNENLRGMKMLEKDYIEWAKGLPSNKRMELNVILKKLFSRDLK